METKDIRTMSVKEILQKVKELRMELLKERFSAAANQQKNPLKKRAIRRDVARLLTIAKEKENGK